MQVELKQLSFALYMRSFNVVPVKYPHWSGSPASVIVGIKQIKIDFYSAGADFTEIMAA